MNSPSIPTILDFTEHARTGIRGRRAETYLQARSYPLPGQPNQSCLCDNGHIVARLAQNEYWLLAAAEPHRMQDNPFEIKYLPEHDCYPLFCRDSHAWLVLVGPGIDELMRSLCAMDLSLPTFPDGHVAQTMVARINAIVIRQSLDRRPCLHLLFDMSFRHYFEAVLRSALATG